MESSISWPSPVRCFCTNAAVIARAICTPVPESPVVVPGRIGGPSGIPVTEKAPAAAWATMSMHL